MGRNVGLIETTLRDGNQSVWAYRMTTAMMLPMLPVMDEAGFRAIEPTTAIQFDACVRYLRENPWERLRLIRQRIRRTPLRMLGMSQFFSIGRVLPDDVVSLFLETCARNGVDEFWVMGSMNDIRLADNSIRTLKQLGRRVEGTILYTVSPVHDDDYFVRVAREYVSLGVDGLVIKDAGGLLTPDAARTLVPRIVEAAGGLEVYCHSHCLTGLGPAANLEAVEGGASAIWTCTDALANGPSLPASGSMARHLELAGYEVGIDHERLREIDAFFASVAARYALPRSRPAEYDPSIFVHQMPGGMLANFKKQLAELGMADRLPQVLEETPRVRAELGYPNMQTPQSQFVATQALLNVLHGRYTVVPDEVRRLALGYWGHTPGPIDPDILDRVTGGEEPISERPGSLLPPEVERVRREQGPFDSDEDLLLSILFMPKFLDALKAAGPMRTDHPLRFSPIVDIVRLAASDKAIRRFSLMQPESPPV
jgi:oxaloacetate decarboxylase (Na+ extruding) subunit alpha